MEKWALKLGLPGEQAEYNQALHWLTSAKGEDPALIGLTRFGGGGSPKNRSGGAVEPWAGMPEINSGWRSPEPWRNRVKEMEVNRYVLHHSKSGTY